MNDNANKKLLLHAQEKQKEVLHEYDLRMKNVYSVLAQQLREKRTHQMELARIKHHMEKRGDMNKEYVEEVKFMLATMSVVSILMALVWNKEWFLYISPVYFLFVLYNW